MKKMEKIIQELSSFSSKKKITSKSLFNEYLKIFYSQTYSFDFVDYSKDELFYLALSSFEFFSNKPKNKPKIKLYNPSVDPDGFDSSCTIVDIINDDMPFLLDSVIIHFEKLNIEIKNILHPVYSVARDKDGELLNLSDSDNLLKESVIQIHLSHISSKNEIKNLENDLTKILETVRIIVDDWKKITTVAEFSKKQLNNAKIGEDLEEIEGFVDWIINNNFIFFACLEYDIREKNGEYLLEEVDGSRLGLGRSQYDDIRPHPFSLSSDEICHSVKNPYLVEIVKSRYKSLIHRIANVDRIRVQKFDKSGKVVGEYRFVGLFTSSVYYQSANLIPIIRKKISQIIENSGFSKGSYNAKYLMSTLESYPRDELFQIGYEDLFRISMGIVASSGRSVVRFFPRKDKFNRFVSCLIFIPRDRYNTALREKIEVILADAYNGEITEFYIQITESNLTRLHMIVKTDRHNSQKVTDSEIEQKLINISRVWGDNFKDVINTEFGIEKSKDILNLYNDAFSISYTNRFDAKRAVLDLKKINKSLETGCIVSDLYKSSATAEEVVELKIYSPEKELQLSGIMPVLDSFGFNVIHEHTYLISLANNKKAWIHYFNLNLTKTGGKLTDNIKVNFEDTIDRIWKSEATTGFLNRLIIDANLSYREVLFLRVYSKYLYQAGFRYSQKYTSDVLVKHRDITKLIVELFIAKFDPSFKEKRQEKIDEISNSIKVALGKVSEINDDLVIRKFFNAIESTIRTNFYQKKDSGEYKDYVSFKFNSASIKDLPLPVPYAEIFVFSANCEAIHLRGGKVARGGLRWSDRHEDFRTEVLGLMKAQMTKNAVIVPVGSKGGFVVKKDTTGMNRDQIQQTGIECYKTLLRGLLDITDNVVNGKIVHPADVVRYDETDPYLVVAADKGTATFSDIANAISAEYNFWLGDAFASGGSVGYDHKKMGITAKGGWISVKRHFAEMGIDTQTQDFTCVGIGDLSGDVFGNGMLLSKHIKLVAAFNHLHIFLDPNPDTEKSFKERARMFNLPRSSWTDYDQSLISKGGGIFERSAKSIKLSSEIKKVLDIAEDEMTPNDLMKAILKSPVDLIWNGGIGTYVKAIDESHSDVGDRFNDELRINGSDLRCKVVGEGGNLGFTQKGRIEYAMNGGRINTDAMDNSAGVDCSDHEVNIKIALTDAMKTGKLTLEKRNKILESMTDEVSELVLADNRLQTQAVTVSYSRGHLSLGDYIQFLGKLEKTGLLNRKVEFLPNNKEIIKRQSEKKGMTRPELCVMLAYSKMDLYSHILGSNLIKDKYFEKFLFSYFPTILQKDFADEIRNHQLRAEIIATQVTNLIINRSGIYLINQIASDNGFEMTDIVKSYVIVCDSFGLEEVWKEIESLDGKIPVEIQIKMFLAVSKLLERSVLWLLRNSRKAKDITSIINEYGDVIESMFKSMEGLLAKASKDSYDRKMSKYLSDNVPQKLAKKISAMDPMGSAYDIIEIGKESNLDVKLVGKIYSEVGTRLSLKWLRSSVASLSINDYWQKLSSKTILEDLYCYQMKITSQVVNFDKNSSLEKWIENQAFLVERYDGFIADLKSQVNPDLSMFVVALNRIKALIN